MAWAPSLAVWGNDTIGAMVEFVVVTEIAAPPARVWRALCDPVEVVVWDTGVEGALDAPPDYPRPGQHVRWRYRGGMFRLLHDRPQEVVEERTLRSLLAVGPWRFDETYTLAAADAGTRTRLLTRMVVGAVVPVLGDAVVRRYVAPQAERAVWASMRALKRHCEANVTPNDEGGQV
jgi:uncharacterized protein YndB with AHSA1/START domain